MWALITLSFKHSSEIRECYYPLFMDREMKPKEQMTQKHSLGSMLYQHLLFRLHRAWEAMEKGTGRVRTAARPSISSGPHKMRALQLKISHQAVESTAGYLHLQRGN